MVSECHPTATEDVNSFAHFDFQLEEHIVHLREELDREREERNYFQVERDRMHSFREITERQLEEAKAELKNLAKEVEAEEGHHQVEVKVRIHLNWTQK